MAVESKSAVTAAIVGNLLIAATKFTVAALTGSSALLSEGIHSVVDTGNGLLMLYGLHRSAQPPDEAHPMGYGRELYFWSLVVAVSIFAVGGGISVYEGIVHIRHPVEIRNVNWSYGVVGASMLFEGISWLYGWRVFRRYKRGRGVFTAIHASKDPSVFMVLLEDSAALVGLVFALAGIHMGHTFSNPVFDGGASILIGILLAAVALFLGAETRGLLIGEAVDPKTRAEICRIVAGTAHVDRVVNLVTIHVGPHDIMLAVEAAFTPDIDYPTLHATTRAIDENVRARFPDIKHVFFATTSQE